MPFEYKQIRISANFFVFISNNYEVKQRKPVPGKVKEKNFLGKFGKDAFFRKIR